jgi:hypothetical protein
MYRTVPPPTPSDLNDGLGRGDKRDVILHHRLREVSSEPLATTFALWHAAQQR